jgi:hypothetical protein
MATVRKPVYNLEPDWKGEFTQSDIIKAYTWYDENKNEKDASTYLKVEQNIARNFRTLAWSRRMLERGCVFTETSLATIEQMEQEMKDEIARVKAARQAVQAAKVNAPSIQELTEQKATRFISELEGAVDDFGLDGKHTDFNAYEWMTENGVKAAHAGYIANYFRNRSKELLLALSGKDKELAEGYSVLGKARLMNLTKLIAGIVQDADKIGVNQKVTRKPRKKKSVSVEKMLSKLTFKQEDTEFKLNSLNPVKILEAQQLWVFNVKTRKLGVYIAENSAGLAVKGSMIVNYNPSTSISKTLRKPKDVLNTVVTGGKIALRKVMDGINAKPQKLNGRVNKDTILLRVE